MPQPSPIILVVDYKIIVVETSKNITDISYTKNIVNIEIPEDKPRETQEVMGYKYFICEENNLTSVSSSAIFHDEEAFKKALTIQGPVLIDTYIDKDEFVLPMLPPGGSIDDIITEKEGK